MRRIGIRGYLLALGTGVVGVVIGSLIQQQPTTTTVVLFAIGIALVVLSFLGRRREKPVESR